MEGHSLHPMDAEPVALPPAWRRGLIATCAAGVLLTAVGLVADPARTWHSVLLAGFFALGIGLGGLLLVAFSYVTKAGWSVALRRVPEAMAMSLPVGIAGIVLAFLGIPWLYEWSHMDAVARDHLLHEKSAWLNVPFFLARAAVYCAVWLVFANAIVKVSRGQDAAGGAAATRRNVVLSTLLLVAFAPSFSGASFDWIMSLEPHWFSTVFAAYHFAGVIVSALASITVLAIVLKRLGPLKTVLRPDHLHDLGRLTLGFTTFWAYLWFCQHMLIWYGDIPEETQYYVLRQTGAWTPILVLSVIVNWLVPFLALLPRNAKRAEGVMLGVALLLLAGRWLDLYLGILPPALGTSPALGVQEIGPVALILPVTALAILRAFGRARPVPVSDPYLPESLQHHT